MKPEPLIASVQSSPGATAGDPETLSRIAADHVACGIEMLRLESVETIQAVRKRVDVPFIGLIKRPYGETLITATVREVDELLAVGAPVIAFDATGRATPPKDLVDRIHAGGALAMADCDRVETVQAALAAGADWIGTTLAGYTPESQAIPGPDFDFLRAAIAKGATVIAEGRFSSPEQAQQALRMGAAGVVIGGALNDPIKLSLRYLSAMPTVGPVGAVDIGGTWLRFAEFSSDWTLTRLSKIPLPSDPGARLDWIRSQSAGIAKIGVSSGGVVDPHSGVVTEAKPIIPNHVGSEFSIRTLGVPTQALNDGLATAWGHACHPNFVGRRVATLALGTGVGIGFVADHRLFPSHGDYLRLNDIAIGTRTFEDLLGGAALTSKPSEEAQGRAIEAAERALEIVRAMLRPEAIVLAGGVGLAPWLAPKFVDEKEVFASPFGAEAGLYGAAALALYPPVF